MLLRDLVEGVNDYTWYHNVSPNALHTEANLLNIARGGDLVGRTKNRVNNLTNKRLRSQDSDVHEDDIDHELYIDDVGDEPHQKHGEIVLGTSFTRSRKLALGDMEFGAICYEVDGRRIANNNKVVPLDDLVINRVSSPKDMAGHGRRSEAEEFVVGDVKNFARCIKRIHIKPEPHVVIGPDRGRRMVQQALAELVKNFPHIEIEDHTHTKGENPTYNVDREVATCLKRAQTTLSELKQVAQNAVDGKSDDVRTQMVRISQDLNDGIKELRACNPSTDEIAATNLAARVNRVIFRAQTFVARVNQTKPNYK